MRKVGALALAGLALIGLLATRATVASAQLAQNGAGSGVAVGRAVLLYSPSVDLPHPALRFVNARGRATGPGEDLEAKPSLTTLALQALAGAQWMITRHIGLFLDYKLRRADPSPHDLNATSDTTLHTTHIFGGVAVHF